MTDTLFLQSDVATPYPIYRAMLAQHAIAWDAQNNLWAAYSYDACQAMLNHQTTHIPGQNPAVIDSMNEHAATLVNHMVRLSNPPMHATIRQAVSQLFGRMQAVNTAKLLADLMPTNAPAEIDWVNMVAKKLPALLILKSFGFSRDDIDCMLPNIGRLTTIMLPNKTTQQVQDINAIAKDMYMLAERRLCNTAGLRSLVNDNADRMHDKEKSLVLHVSNLLGFLIQSHDAGRGMLSNALLQQLMHQDSTARLDVNHFQKTVIETLRFDPPIQNTRRIAAEDIAVGQIEIKKGQTVLVVLAAANRDPEKFTRPEQYDPSRSNNGQHLSFGAGAHMCVANHLSLQITVDALTHLFSTYDNIALLEQDVRYEPLVNARLPERLRISVA